MPTNYVINLDVKFPALELIDLPSIVKSTTEPWFNQSLARVNDCVVRLGIFHGEFHWHKHDDEDEFFFVVDGVLLLDLEGRTVELKAQQGIVVPRGVLHRTRAREKTVVLMIEGAEIQPTGD